MRSNGGSGLCQTVLQHNIAIPAAFGNYAEYLTFMTFILFVKLHDNTGVDECFKLNISHVFETVH